MERLAQLHHDGGKTDEGYRKQSHREKVGCSRQFHSANIIQFGLQSECLFWVIHD